MVNVLKLLYILSLFSDRKEKFREIRFMEENKVIDWFKYIISLRKDMKKVIKMLFGIWKRWRLKRREKRGGKGGRRGQEGKDGEENRKESSGDEVIFFGLQRKG